MTRQRWLSWCAWLILCGWLLLELTSAPPTCKHERAPPPPPPLPPVIVSAPEACTPAATPAPYLELWPELSRVLASSTQEGLEGFLKPAQAAYYYGVALRPKVRNICEIGFNGGHSATLWLSSNPDIHLYSFDVGAHGYLKYAEAWIHERFPGRLTLTIGDSIDTVPAFAAMHPTLRCDVLHVDGFHYGEHPYKDLMNFRAMANQPNIVLLDDVRACFGLNDWCKAPEEAWVRAKNESVLYQDECVLVDNPKDPEPAGWCIGSYL